MADDAPVEIIIKRVKKSGDHGHHGGAWKVAYADFVTAMMAFFLLLWLLNATTEAQKAGIADYFSPISVSKSSGGAGGMLGGRSISSPGAMTSRTSIPSVSVKINPAQGQTEGNAEEEGGTKNTAKTAAEASKELSPEEKAAAAAAAANANAKKKSEKQHREIETAKFDQVEKKIRQAIQETPDLKNLMKHLIIDQTPDGLRIQVVDRAGKSMFKSGSAKMMDHTKKLIQKIAAAIAPLPNKIRLSGHTDSVPYKGKRNYDNWNLSSDRAQAARLLLNSGALPPSRIESVAGRAASDPLLPKDAKSPRNRRISILLLHTKPPKVAAPPPRKVKAKTGKQRARPSTGTPFSKDWSGPRIR
ncbi:MAG: flagellar motor protein MotB [Alphaproteobacteria bacterium]